MFCRATLSAKMPPSIYMVLSSGVIPPDTALTASWMGVVETEQLSAP